MPYDSTNIAEHFKQRGEWAELLFMARAAEQGLSIVRPWGDSSPYDVAIEHHGYLLRVQIKSTRCHHTAGAYKCHIDSNGVPYREGMLDFIAAYVIPVQVWYIIPFAATRRTRRGPPSAQSSPVAPSLSRRSLSRQGGEFDFRGTTEVPETHGSRVLGWQSEILLAPHRPKSKYARFKEAWHLLRPDPTAAVCPKCGRCGISGATTETINGPDNRRIDDAAINNGAIDIEDCHTSKHGDAHPRYPCPLKPGETCPLLPK